MAVTILLVDDNSRVRHEVALQLQMLGFEVVEAADGLKALVLARDSRFDGVVLDQRMPLMDGLTLARNLRQLPGYGQIPLVLLTTEQLAAVRSEATAAGLSALVAKPVAAAELAAALQPASGHAAA